MKLYKAPWSLSLVIVTVLVTIICFSISAFHCRDLVAMRFGTLEFWQALLPMALVLGAALFTIRGYSISAEAILVHRLFWVTRLPRAGLQSASIEPDALKGAIRTWGNGGMFSASGWYRSPALGKFRAFLMNETAPVILRYGDRIIALSPADAESFAEDLSTNLPQQMAERR